MPSDTSPERQRRAVESAEWQSAITTYDAHRVWVRGVPIDEAINDLGFAGMIFLAWTGRRPDPATHQLLESCLAASIDHGPVTPSAIAARTAASVRQQPVACLATGLLTVTDFHGGAVSGCMEMLERGTSGRDLIPWASAIADQFADEGRRVPGIGHRIHTQDWRAQRLLALVRDLIPGSTAPDQMEALSAEVSARAGRPITVNIDGGVATGLTAIGLDSAYGNLAFAISRSVGLSAHIVEERTRERPMRTINPTLYSYDGPDTA